MPDIEQPKKGMRKFALALIVISAATGLVALKIIPATAWESAIWGAMIMFGSGNVGEHFAKRGQNVQQNP